MPLTEHGGRFVGAATAVADVAATGIGREAVAVPLTAPQLVGAKAAPTAGARRTAVTGVGCTRAEQRLGCRC